MKMKLFKKTRKFSGWTKPIIVSALMLCLIAGIATVLYAATDDYSTVGIDDTTGTVGTEMAGNSTIFKYTNVDAGGAHDQIWAAADTLVITVPANMTACSNADTPGLAQITVRYGLVSGLTTATSGTAIDYNATALDGKWDLASGTRIINIQMDATIASALNADGYGIAVFYQKGSNGTTIPTYADATTDFDIEPNTASAADDENLGAAGDTDGTKTVNVSAAAAAASIALGANSVVGAAGDTTLTITTPIDLANADTIAFTMPDNLDVGSVALSTTTFTYAGSVGFVCATSSQVITCTADGAITAASANIVMSGITSKYATTSQTISSIAVYDTTASANIATGSSGTVTDTTDADAVASVALGTNSVVGTAGTTTLTITTPVDLANTDTIVFTMPDNLKVSSLATTTVDTFSGAGSFSCAASSQIITCTANGAITAASATIAMTGITSKYATTKSNHIKYSNN